MSDKNAERHLVVRFTCAESDSEAVQGLLSEFIGPARQEEGCLYYDLYQNVADPTVFYILDGWRDEASAAAHGEHPNVQRVLQSLLPLLASEPNIITNRRISDPQ